MEALFRFIMIRPAETIDEEDAVDVESKTDFQSDLQLGDYDNGNSSGDHDSESLSEDEQGQIKQKVLRAET